METIQTRCCIVGGGPAGMMLGLLLARSGIDVTVIEKHGDFLRDFRGDTVHPSTLEVIHELGLLADFLKRPHQEVRELGGQIAGERMMIADFSQLRTPTRSIVLMPQWHFLDFLAEHARKHPNFHLHMKSEAVDVLTENGRVLGVRVATPNGPTEVRSDLTIGADGRGSIVREKVGLPIQHFGAPIDVLWMSLSRRTDDPGQTLGYFGQGHVFVMLERGEHWQCAFVIPKGGFDDLRRTTIQSLRDQIAAIVPFLSDRVGELRDWDDIKLLTVRIDRLSKWAMPGLLCIGDAAHAMSPVGGVGINLAIQDAVAAANLLASKLRQGAPQLHELEQVQRRRELPTRVTQRLQILIHDRVINRTLAGGTTKVPTVVRMLNEWSFLRRFPARLIGLGIRPEHVLRSEPLARS